MAELGDDALDNRDDRKHPEGSDDDNDDNECLPSHTLFLRRALRASIKTLNECPKIDWEKLRVDVDSKELLKEARQRRQEALQDFYSRHVSTLHDLSGSEDDGKEQLQAPSVDMIEKLSDISPRVFYQRYQQGNVPCLVRCIDDPHYFGYVQSCLSTTSHEQNDTNDLQLSPCTFVNREWFLQHVGADTVVPVRYDPTSYKQALLDKEGRANECQVVEMKLQEWIALVDRLETDDQQPVKSSYYLKDWHLVALLESKDELPHPLYRVPKHFGKDLLAMMNSYSDGDYFFCYWGPPGSKTSIHSDVLNSFSWSLNICGWKKWSFYPPTLELTLQERHLRYDDTCLVLYQRPGELIFVPAGWKHDVVNGKPETLSINHNWITTANIDLVWEVLQSEMKSINEELAKWKSCDNSADADMEAHESMLRGCTGLDVSAYFAMILVGIKCSVVSLTEKGERFGVDKDTITDERRDLICLLGALRRLVDTDSVQLNQRLVATLKHDKLVSDIMILISSLLGSWQPT